MTDLQKIIIQYIQLHPGVCASDIAEHVGKSRVSVSNTMIGMVQKGYVTTEMLQDGSCRGRRVYYPGNVVRDASHIIRNAQHIGGHFGILAAQVIP